MLRRLLIAVVLCAGLGGLVYWSNREQKKAEDKPAKDAPPRILAVNDGDLAQITMKRKDGTETVVKKNAGGKWEITSPKPLATDNDAVVSVLSNISSMNADRIVEEKASDLAGYGLNSPSLEFAFTKKDGKTGKLTFGDDTPTGGNVFVMLAGDPRVYTLSSSIKTSLDKTSQDLRDKRLLTFDQDKLSRVELTAKKSTVEFGKNNQNEWTIVKPTPMRADGWQVEELIRKLKDAKMDTAISDDDAKKAAAAYAAGAPVATARFTDAGGTQTLDVRKSKEDYYAKSSAVEGVYKVPADLGTGVDKAADDFRNKKLFDFGFSEPTKIEVKNGDKPLVTYGKAGEKWFLGPKAIDSTSLQNFADKLRDLTATKFLDGGFTAPVFSVTVTFAEGKRTDKVQIAKSGDDYTAMRENEPAVYALDPGNVTQLIKTFGDIKEAQPEKKK